MTTHTTGNDIRRIFNEHGLDLRLLDIDSTPSGNRIESYYSFVAIGKTANGTHFHITFGFHDYETGGQRELSVWKSRISDYINFWDCPFSEDADADPACAEADRAEVSELYNAIYDELTRIAA